jgi:hypothetical protein
MPEKSNSRGRKIKKPARPTPAAARTKPSPRQPEPAYHVTCPDMKVSISHTPPRGVKGARKFATFDEAKSAAIEALIAAIERAEQQLAALKHANDCQELESAP